MATDLCLITNSKLTGRETKTDWEDIVAQLNQLTCTTLGVNNLNQELTSKGYNWEYEIEDEHYDEEDYPFNVNFSGNYPIQPNLYSNVGVLCTSYKYRELYELYKSDTLLSFRKDVYDIIKIIGGTEVIYLPNNGCSRLSKYLNFMAFENVPYETIKSKMFAEFGSPVNDYSKLNYETLNYSTINEFMLDEFSDCEG